MKKKSVGLVIATAAIIGILLGQSVIFTLSNNIVPIISNVSASPTTADVYEEIEFTVSLANNATHISGPVNYYVYNFHDGSEPLVSTEGSVSHGFLYEGYYLVTVIAVGTGGITDEATLEVIINNERPQSNMTIPLCANEDEIVSLEASDIVDTLNDLEVLQFQWLLGDGNYIEGATVNWSWRTAGEYPVTLIVSDDQNALDMVTQFIEISNVIPDANFVISTPTITEDEPILFNALPALIQLQINQPYNIIGTLEMEQ